MKKLLATTFKDLAGFSYEEYLEFCEINGYEPAEKESDGFYNWVYEEIAHNYEQDLENIKGFEPYNKPVSVTGTLGLWDGPHDIVPTVLASVYDAIIECSRSADDVDVEWDDGQIIVKGYHHDGVNVFYIGEKLPYLY